MMAWWDGDMTRKEPRVLLSWGLSGAREIKRKDLHGPGRPRHMAPRTEPNRRQRRRAAAQRGRRTAEVFEGISGRHDDDQTYGPFSRIGYGRQRAYWKRMQALKDQRRGLR